MARLNMVIVSFFPSEKRLLLRSKDITFYTSKHHKDSAESGKRAVCICVYPIYLHNQVYSNHEVHSPHQRATLGQHQPL